ncbi:hypothetical protein CTEN210_04229 [Chaetoceros tenuissimus]|uniref:Ion transport domain-containing protein n=1 Tax=Chaetoceros tenuissimus TaxID=426638 RepID=A0AAD3CL94_9STRA|nr:hypothetical protein CTEN210_04229 [Chaetoceros tenuissimus]
MANAASGGISGALSSAKQKGVKRKLAKMKRRLSRFATRNKNRREYEASSREEEQEVVSTLRASKDDVCVKKIPSVLNIYTTFPNKNEEYEVVLKKEDPFHEESKYENSYIAYSQTKLGSFLNTMDPVILVLIIVNAIQMGLATFDFVSENPKVDSIFEKVDLAFLSVFTVEVCLNCIHHYRFDRLFIQNKRIKFAPKSEEEEELQKENFPWLVFDALVVLLSWAFASFSIIRAFRILRVLRLIKKVEQLKSVVAALIGVLPKMGVVAFLLSLLFIIFGVAFTILFGDLYERGLTEYDYFSRMDQTFLTLFQLMTFDDLATVARSVMDTYSWSWTLIVTWSIITGFVAMNLIIAIICESLVNLQEQKQMEQKAAEKLDLPYRSKLSREDSRRLKMETMNMMESQKSMKSIMTNITDEYVFQLEDMVDTILDDQREFICKFDAVKRQCKETLDNLPPEQSVVEIRKILGI